MSTRSLVLAIELGEVLTLIDYVHCANPETPIEETMRAMAQLRA